ncbi:M56 family metallopeptidase [Flavobacterium fluviale]|uniref:M56 family peptidase n=1 Tax=Flavobacterium fluviale TaxID=2249356 RepID=A0A344LVJ0_9FLAO|nr:M56 family metallopeptidase [Flavobacterium fluviale]AXB57932.1 M56 family peptidase [Flavobacterium fluviale]
MEALLIYIAKSCSLMLFFYCVYYFLLRKETFFNNNRWFLLFGLIVSAVLPLLNYTRVIWIDAPALGNSIQSSLMEIPEKEVSTFNWSHTILLLYGIGFLAFIIKFAIDFYSLNSIIKGKKIQQQADFKFIDVSENIAPFSYFEYIVYNSSLYTSSELENIIEHEKVHSDQNHTVDVLISRLFSIIFWFNPIIWLYKKAITQNLEFIADSEAAKKLQDKKSYQYTLLKITTHENCVAITNHFYQSLIKKRIVMLNKNQSKKKNSWKYYTVIPALAAFVLLFQIEVIAKEKPQTIKETTGETKAVDIYKIHKGSTDAELSEIKNKLKEIHSVNFEVSDIKRDAKNNLTSIKVDVTRGKQQAQSIQTGDQTIKDFGVLIITDQKGNKTIGIQTFEDSKSSKAKTGVSNNITTLTSDDDSKKSTDSKIIITNNNQNTKIETNVNSNSNTSTKTNSNTNSTISTIVTTDDNDAVTKITTSNGKTNVAFSNGSSKFSNTQESPLIIVDGKEMPSTFDLEDLKAQDIKSMSVFKGINAVSKYGEKGSNGVIEIETRK